MCSVHDHVRLPGMGKIIRRFAKKNLLPIFTQKGFFEYKVTFFLALVKYCRNMKNCAAYVILFMYRRERPILCTLYGAVDFINVLKSGWGGGGG
jgi:hypothetical protein